MLFLMKACEASKNDATPLPPVRGNNRPQRPGEAGARLEAPAGMTWPVGFQALLDTPPVTAKSPGSIIWLLLIPELSLLLILKSMPGFSLLAELLGSDL